MSSEKEFRLEISPEVVNKMMKDDAPHVEKPLLVGKAMLVFEIHLGQAFSDCVVSRVKTDRITTFAYPF